MKTEISIEIRTWVARGINGYKREGFVEYLEPLTVRNLHNLDATRSEITRSGIRGYGSIGYAGSKTSFVAPGFRVEYFDLSGSIPATVADLMIQYNAMRSRRHYHSQTETAIWNYLSAKNPDITEEELHHAVMDQIGPYGIFTLRDSKPFRAFLSEHPMAVYAPLTVEDCPDGYEMELTS